MGVKTLKSQKDISGLGPTVYQWAILELPDLFLSEMRLNSLQVVHLKSFEFTLPHFSHVYMFRLTILLIHKMGL